MRKKNVNLLKTLLLITGIVLSFFFSLSNNVFANEIDGMGILTKPTIDVAGGGIKQTFDLPLKISEPSITVKETKNTEGVKRMDISYQKTQPVLLQKFNLRFKVDNSVDKFYRLVAGQWEPFDLRDEFFFGQEIILFNTEERVGILLVFGESYGRLHLEGDDFIINFLDGANVSVKEIRSSIYFAPISNVGVENNILYKSKFPDGKESIVVYTADDLHAVFDKTFAERLKFFDVLKSADPSFKTTFVVVADVFNRRGKLVDTELVDEIKQRDVHFGFHGVYHSYPVDDPINPQLFDPHFVDFNGKNSNDTEWLQQIISKGVNVLKSQGFDYTVFRAPQYQYSDESVSVLAENGIHLTHNCQLAVYNPIRVETVSGWLWKVYDSPCDRGLMRVVNGREVYKDMYFKEQLALNGKETSFHVHIWEFWSGNNPWDSNAEYHTYESIVDYLTFLEKQGIDYNWQYASDYYQYLESLNSVKLQDQVVSGNKITAILIKEKPLLQNIYLKLLLKDGQVMKSASIGENNIRFSQQRKNFAILEIPADFSDKSPINIEVTDDWSYLKSDPLIANPSRNFEGGLSLSAKVNVTGNKANYLKLPNLDFNTAVLVGLFIIYVILFFAGVLRYWTAKKNA